ncbi:MAG: hypothetical protein ABIT83_13210, partial [Massilia sp.]
YCFALSISIFCEHLFLHLRDAKCVHAMAAVSAGRNVVSAAFRGVLQDRLKIIFACPGGKSQL